MPSRGKCVHHEQQREGMHFLLRTRQTDDMLSWSSCKIQNIQQWLYGQFICSTYCFCYLFHDCFFVILNKVKALVYNFSFRKFKFSQIQVYIFFQAWQVNHMKKPCRSSWCTHLLITTFRTVMTCWLGYCFVYQMNSFVDIYHKFYQCWSA